MQKNFSNKRVFSQLMQRCKSSKLKLPCEMDSWHGFDSNNIQALVDLGQYLEGQGWRFIGMWPNPEGTNNFHLRVAKTGFYGETQLIEEIEMMKKLAIKFAVDNYSDCSPQPFVTNIAI